MENATIAAIVIFVVAYALIISEKVHRTIVGLFGAMLMILFGIIDQETAVHHIDFNTLGLLMGMMIIVNITSETGLFNYLAIWAAQKVKARPVALLVVLSTITMVCSALLDNVTTHYLAAQGRRYAVSHRADPVIEHRRHGNPHRRSAEYHDRQRGWA